MKVFKSGICSSIPFYMPVLIFQASGHCGGFIYRFLHNEVELSDIDSDDVYTFLCDKLTRFGYNVIRDAIIRSCLLTMDPLLHPAMNELAFVALTVTVDTIPMSSVITVLSKVKDIINEYKDRIITSK